MLESTRRDSANEYAWHKAWDKRCEQFIKEKEKARMCLVIMSKPLPIPRSVNGFGDSDLQLAIREHRPPFPGKWICFFVNTINRNAHFPSPDRYLSMHGA